MIAYQQLNQYEDTLFSQLTKLLSETALLVCEGQQYDVDFGTRNDVSLEAYIQMIQLKTAVLLGCALRMGALVGNATTVAADCLYEFGVNLGIAFQLQDDLLDSFGDPKNFGKKVGGDIIENKKENTLFAKYVLRYIFSLLIFPINLDPKITTFSF